MRLIKKYELTDDCISFMDVSGEKKLRRIRALCDFGHIKKGTLGGYIEAEWNLSHDGLCWVADNAHVSKGAVVKDDAIVGGNAHITDFAVVSNRARVGDSARIYEGAVIDGVAKIHGMSKISGHVNVGGNAYVSNARISGWDNIRGNAFITSNRDFCSITNMSHCRFTLTFFRCRCKGSERKTIGVFFDNTVFDTLDSFKEQIKENYAKEPRLCNEYLLAADFVECRLSEEPKGLFENQFSNKPLT